ncbi:hypothetical protein I6F35_32090 [Bradyrhizobium sp. BRP22]|uniref:hypothetical protein n=1 Tax=Bradyrhizobium sp. BRP22 TaxID=2793821 RepID=UPI001CD598D6|nr:hypothetical protein [Bradyrhizobium sp. BRP22]MCA1457772.1 hypothetical protein [Bradyrhizobium sp. BRP22]
MPEENDLEGPQDQGGKHGGQAGMPEPERSASGAPVRPRDAERKGKVVGHPRSGRTDTGAK